MTSLVFEVDAFSLVWENRLDILKFISNKLTTNLLLVLISLLHKTLSCYTACWTLVPEQIRAKLYLIIITSCLFFLARTVNVLEKSIVFKVDIIVVSGKCETCLLALCLGHQVIKLGMYWTLGYSIEYKIKLKFI